MQLLPGSYTLASRKESFILNGRQKIHEELSFDASLKVLMFPYTARKWIS